MNNSSINKMAKEIQDIMKISIKSKDQEKILPNGQIPKYPKVHNIQGSVLFVDIRHSTDMLKENGRKDIAKIYKIFSKIVGAAVSENDGKVQQILGDGALCIFTGNSSGRNAVNATVSVNTYLAKCYNNKCEELLRVECGYGIKTGHIYATKMMVENIDNIVYPSIVTSYACKLCNKAKSGQVIMDNNTQVQIDKNFNKYLKKYDANDWSMENVIWEVQ